MTFSIRNQGARARIEEMMPAFRFAQTMFKEKRDRDSFRESSREIPIPIVQEARG